jgi:hypothetical protein
MKLDLLPSTDIEVMLTRKDIEVLGKGEKSSLIFQVLRQRKK